jgi:hypothetical protein
MGVNIDEISLPPKWIIPALRATRFAGESAAASHVARLLAMAKGRFA